MLTKGKKTTKNGCIRKSDKSQRTFKREIQRKEISDKQKCLIQVVIVSLQ